MRDWNETMGQNNQDVSNVNKSALLKFLRQNGVCSRAQISKAMGLTQASISKITAQLLEDNIVQETGYISPLTRAAKKCWGCAFPAVPSAWGCSTCLARCMRA